MKFWQLFYFINILEKHTDGGRESNRNILVNINIRSSIFYLCAFGILHHKGTYFLIYGYVIYKLPLYISSLVSAHMENMQRKIKLS
jgi:hypothetical protein